MGLVTNGKKRWFSKSSQEDEEMDQVFKGFGTEEGDYRFPTHWMDPGYPGDETSHLYPDPPGIHSLGRIYPWLPLWVNYLLIIVTILGMLYVIYDLWPL